MSNKTNKQKLSLGLDLGTAWHGWALSSVNDDESKNEVIMRGSHYFGQKSNPDGTYPLGERGVVRRTRRSIRRTKQRKNDFKKLVSNKYKDIFNFDVKEVLVDQSIANPYELAVKGLKQELTPKELFKLLHWVLSFRGCQYNVKNDLPVFETLYESFKQGKVRGVGARQVASEKIVEQDKETGEVLKTEQIKNTFVYSRNQMAEELSRIIDNASYLKGTNFKKEYLGDSSSNDIRIKSGIFNRQRDYAYGPGSEKSPSEWGIYDESFFDTKTGERLFNNLWDKSISKCPVSEANGENPVQRVAPKYFICGEIASLVSELSFTKIDNRLLTAEQRNTIWNYIINNPSKKPGLALIRKALDLDDENVITNYPSKSKSLDENFQELKIFRNLLKNKIISLSLDDLYSLDKIRNIDEILNALCNKYLIMNASDDKAIAKELMFNKDKQESISYLKEIDKNHVINDYELVTNLERFTDLNKSYHSFGQNALLNYIEKNIFEEKSISLSYFYSKEITKAGRDEYILFNKTDFKKEREYINEHLFDNKIFLSPDIKNATIEAIRIINRFLKYCKQNNYYLSNIVIETTSNDKQSFNSKRKREEISERNKFLEELTKDIKNKTGASDSTVEKIKVLILTRVNETNVKKKNIWSEDYFDLYCGEPIYINDVLKNPELYEIEHALPLSKSAMNGYNNKILIKKNLNHSKSNMLPSQFANEKAKQLWEDQVKLENFELYKTLITLEIPKHFLASQLNNVSNIMRQVVDGLQAWSEYQDENNKYFDGIEIQTVNGATTQKIRKMAKLEEKDRSDNEHHSIDASICSILGGIKEFNEMKPVYNHETKHNIYKTHINIFKEGNINFEKICSSIEDAKWELSAKKLSLFFNETLDEKLAYLYSKKQNSKYHFSGKVTKDGCNKFITKIDEKGNKKYIRVETKDLFKLDNKFSWDKKIFLNPESEISILRKIFDDYKMYEFPFKQYMEEMISNDFKEWEKYFLSRQVAFINHLNNVRVYTKIKYLGNTVSPEIVIKKDNQKSPAKSYKTFEQFKCVLVVTDNKKTWFQGESYADIFMKKNKEKLESGELKIIDVYEIYKELFIDENNELWVLCSFVKEKTENSNRIVLKNINNPERTIKKGYSVFKELGLKKFKQYY